MVAEHPGKAPLDWRYATRQALWAVVDAVFPARCAGCSQAGQRFCKACLSALAYLPRPVCERCGYPVQGQAGRLCAACRQASPSALSGIRSVAFFEGPLQQALHSLKYKRDIILADTLARLLYDAWVGHPVPGDVVMPIPLSPQRLRERGYNQAGLLARGFAELAGLPYTFRGAVRVRNTTSQVGLSAAQRRENMGGAFSGAVGRVAGRAVILVDDVCTTGSTLAACAEALTAAGAASVWGFTLARARAPGKEA